MTSAICTLFEGHYHYGVGALANSLYAHGFRGTIYVGYRGPLPPWVRGENAETLKAETLKSDGVGKDKRQNSEGEKSEIGNQKSEIWTDFTPAQGLTLRFIPLATKVHFTNYKPDFMLEVWEKQCPQAEAMFYFDPDITIKCRWTFFEEWVEAGIALCADVNLTMPQNHPIRHRWKQFLKDQGMTMQRDLGDYFNGGYVGVSHRDQKFLRCWKTLIGLIGESVGGLEKMIVAGRAERFYIPDQDALNISAMTAESPISPMGQDGMDFQHGGGGYVMAHAIGGKKPWNKSFVRAVLHRAAPPSRADKEFFKHVEHPIRLYPPGVLLLKRFKLKAASLLGRFMRNM